jgi:hypothetical protein
MTTKSPIHLLLRFSDSRLKEGDTIAAHNAVVQGHGAVWFGKMGSPVSQLHIDELNEQIKREIPTFVYLVKGNRRKTTAYKARLVLSTRVYPKEEQELIPPYYRDHDIPRYVKFWVKIGEITLITLDELNQMQVASSVLPLAESLVKSSTGHFIIRKDKLIY